MFCLKACLHLCVKAIVAVPVGHRLSQKVTWVYFLSIHLFKFVFLLLIICLLLHNFYPWQAGGTEILLRTIERGASTYVSWIFTISAQIIFYKINTRIQLGEWKRGVIASLVIGPWGVEEADNRHLSMVNTWHPEINTSTEHFCHSAGNWIR